MTGAMSDHGKSNIFLGASGIAILVGILVAQSVFPGYDASKSAISDLGSPIELVYHGTPGVLTLEQPASAILIGSLLLFSILLLMAARSLRLVVHRKWFGRFLMLYGIGALLLVLSYVPYYEFSGQLIQGTFTADPLPLKIGALLHLLGAAFLFLFGASFTLSSRSLLKRPANTAALLVGTLILVAFALNLAGLDLGLGAGGMERLSSYPLFAWTMIAGGYLHYSFRQDSGD
ncbi:MAG: DUF998 domain-containing protein [Thaumarchaeota archaeon]|nr:DUF998 domain-containing protein [Nitrososphaerota archaeon]